VSKEVGEEERGARGGVHRRSDNGTSVDVAIDPHRRRLGRSQICCSGLGMPRGGSEMNRSVVALACRWR
jgi:hypothetical protein